MKKRNIRGAEGIAKGHTKGPDTLRVPQVEEPERPEIEISEENIATLAKGILEEYLKRNNVKKKIDKWDMYPGFFGPNGQFTMYGNTFSSKPLGMVAYNDAEKMTITQKDLDTMSRMIGAQNERKVGEQLDELTKICGHTKYMGGMALLTALIVSGHIHKLPPGEYMFPNALFTNEQEQWCVLIVDIAKSSNIEFDLYPLERPMYNGDRRVLVLNGQSEVNKV